MGWTPSRIGRAALSYIAVAVLVGACAGCATVGIAPELEDVDRFERLNRGVYRFNRGVDRHVLRPLARAYDRVTPPPVEQHVRKFFTNLRAPTDILNNWLQGKFRPGFADLGRFLLNSTAGLGGFFDPAVKLGLERHPEDFGQTLASWGVPSGGYVVFPFLGPGSVRDWGALTLDMRTDQLSRIGDSSARNVLWAWRVVSHRAALLPAERTLEQSFDEYTLVREAYWQRRRYLLYDETPPEEEDYLYLDNEEEAPTP